MREGSRQRGPCLPSNAIYPWRGGGWRAGPVDRPVPSTWGEGAGSMGGQAGPSQHESERERGPHSTRCSSELKLASTCYVTWQKHFHLHRLYTFG